MHCELQSPQKNQNPPNDAINSSQNITLTSKVVCFLLTESGYLPSPDISIFPHICSIVAHRSRFFIEGGTSQARKWLMSFEKTTIARNVLIRQIRIDIPQNQPPWMQRHHTFGTNTNSMNASYQYPISRRKSPKWPFIRAGALAKFPPMHIKK